MGAGQLVQMAEYNVIGQLIAAALTPYVQAIVNELQSITPLLPLGPADLALAVLRAELTEDDAAAQASMSGLDKARFHTLVQLTGDAPGPGDLAVALRRGIIDRKRYDRGIAQGRLRNEWGDTIRELSIQLPSPIEPLEALLEGQLPEGKARELYLAYGGDPDSFQWRFDSRGASPTPLQLADMANRGIIPWTGTGPTMLSYEQGFLEGDFRNKWSDAIHQAAVYLPPPRTIGAMYREGSITQAQASDLLTKSGVPPELVAAELASASATKTQATKDLAQSTLLALYRDKLATAEQATGWLVGLGYDASEAALILAVEDAALQQHFLSLAIGRMHSLYVAHRVDKAGVTTALGQLGVAADGMTVLLQTWDLERATNIRTLTEAQVTRAFVLTLLDQPTATAQLVALGYSEADAVVLLSIANKGPLVPPLPPTV